MNKYTEPLSANSHSPSPAPPFGGLPLPAGEGSEYPHFLLEDGARRPPSYFKSASAFYLLSVFAPLHLRARA